MTTLLASAGVGQTRPADNPAAQPRVEVVATRLEAPWALAFDAAGALYLTERPGRIRVIRNGRLVQKPLATLDVAAAGEGGLLGLALDPSFEANGFLYVCYTTRKQGGLVNRVSRLTVRDDHAGAERVLLDDIPGAELRDGGRLKFGPDGMLYLGTGDASVQELAQRRDSLAGKILRLARDGSIPADNPFPGSPVYALGFRNPQGLAWDGHRMLVEALRDRRSRPVAVRRGAVGAPARADQAPSRSAGAVAQLPRRDVGSPA